MRRGTLGLMGVGLLVLGTALWLLVGYHQREVGVRDAILTYHEPAIRALGRVEADAAAWDRGLDPKMARERIGAALEEIRRLSERYGPAPEATAARDLARRWAALAAPESSAAPGLDGFRAAAADLRHRHELDRAALLTEVARADPWWVGARRLPLLPLLLLLGIGVVAGHRLFGRISRAVLRQQELAEALRRTEAEHVRAQSLAHLGHWSWEMATDRATRSAESYRILGHTPETLGDGAEAFFALIHPDDVDSVRRKVAEAFAVCGTYSCEYRIRRPDGTERWIDSQGQVAPDPATGKPVRIDGTLQDVTARKEAEAALRASEARFREIFNDSAVGIGLGELDGTVLDLNPAMERFLGYTAGELRGRSFEALAPPEDRPPYRAFLARAREQGAPGTLDRRYVRKDGRVVWGRLSLGVLRDADGRPRQAVGIVQDITERKAMEESLRANETLLRQVTESVDQVFWLRDPVTNRMHYMSPAYERIWGRPREPLYTHGRAWMEAVPPEDVPRLREFLDRAYQEGRPFECNHRIVRPDGSERMIHARGFPVRDDAGNVYRWAGVCADVTELHALQNAVRESEERLRQVLDTIREVYWVWRADTRQVLFVSAAYESIWGRSRESLYRNPESWRDAIHPDDRPRIDGMRNRQLEAEAEAVFRIVRPDGTVRWIRNRSYPVRDAEGRVYRLVGAATDITEQKRAEASLREQQERARLILDSTAEGIYEVDLEGRCTFANAACLRLLGYAREAELLGRNMHALIQHTRADGTPFPDHACDVHHAIRGGRHLHSGNDSVLRADGTRLAADVWAHPVHQDGKLVGGVVTFVDATERRRAEAERHRYQDELAHVTRLATMGEMASGLAHEINQPLAAIAAFAHGSIQRLRQPGGPDAAGVLESLEQIAAQAGRAGEIVRHLREFVGKGQGRRAPEDINALVASAARLIEPEARDHQIALRLELGRELPPVAVDRIQVDQVLINLMKNGVEALAHSALPRRLTLRTRKGVNGSVEITVSDNGPGLPAAMADRLFHPFYTTKPHGLGMGLAISRSIVEAHGGELAAVAAAGPGAAFRFTVPVEEAHGVR